MPETHVTQLLDRIRGGDDAAVDQLLPHVYGELRSLADGVFRSQNAGHTLQPTALVHEAWMKMAGSVGRLEGRRHFFAVAARAMRQVLADHARIQNAQKRGGPAGTIMLEEGLDAAAPELDLVGLHDCLERLESLNPRHARVVEMRVLGAMTIQEIAETLDVSKRTVDSDWGMARAWLWDELVGD